MMINISMDASYVVISVMGPHAGETSEHIFERKRQDIQVCGLTIWLVRSYKARVEMVQKLGKLHRESYVFMISPSTPNGSEPTSTNSPARQFSSDQRTWKLLPPQMGPVTGHLTQITCGLVFDRLDLIKCDCHIDLWSYADFNEPQIPIKFGQGHSTFCALKKDMSDHPDRMTSHVRQIQAIAHLREPYAVWLR
jgi:hypothetical protein